MTTPVNTDHHASDRAELGSIRCGLYKLTPAGVTRADLGQPSDELVLFVEVAAGDRPRKVVVQLLRGDWLRDQWETRLAGGARVARAFRLCLGDGSSSRLSYRVLIDGRERVRQTVLLVPGPVDAQGRLSGSQAGQGASPATLLAFADELERQLDVRNHSLRKND